MSCSWELTNAIAKAELPIAMQFTGTKTLCADQLGSASWQVGLLPVLHNGPVTLTWQCSNRQSSGRQQPT